LLVQLFYLFLHLIEETDKGTKKQMRWRRFL